MNYLNGVQKTVYEKRLFMLLLFSRLKQLCKEIKIISDNVKRTQKIEILLSYRYTTNSVE